MTIRLLNARLAVPFVEGRALVRPAAFASKLAIIKRSHSCSALSNVLTLPFQGRALVLAVRAAEFRALGEQLGQQAWAWADDPAVAAAVAAGGDPVAAATWLTPEQVRETPQPGQPGHRLASWSTTVRPRLDIAYTNALILVILACCHLGLPQGAVLKCVVLNVLFRMCASARAHRFAPASRTARCR